VVEIGGGHEPVFQSASHLQEFKMAETDLDGVIRSIGKTQHKALMAEARRRHARLTGLAAKAKTKEGKARFKQTAKDMMLLANAAARRLQITAENAADSYARAMKNALEEIKAAEAKASAAAKAKAAKKKG
jgi:siderophore synthetase component